LAVHDQTPDPQNMKPFGQPWVVWLLTVALASIVFTGRRWKSLSRRKPSGIDCAGGDTMASLDDHNLAISLQYAAQKISDHCVEEILENIFMKSLRFVSPECLLELEEAEPNYHNDLALSPNGRRSFIILPSSVNTTSGNVNASSSPVDDAASSASSPAIDFLSLCHRLKTTKRAGWIRKDVKDPESIADHMYRMGLMALIASDIPGIDRNKCIKMAIVHDIAEAIVGDITPSDGVSKEEKSRREREALDHMCKMLGGGSRASEVAELWMEYEANSSPEAKFVKDLDKVEMILQALEYEDEQQKDLDEFFESTAGKFQTETGKAWALEIVSRRTKNHHPKLH
ncbi:HD domain-containing protein 2-like, partial [Neltuma alba]|uniref:HD domain-containing protein 2-like n=1 Tax=Neltuma alba TaxID=207710 RepID=UPI0010A2E2B3